jgi:hypothetical protein
MRSHWTQLLCTAPSIQMFAGYETTAAQTSWALILLLQHPDYLGHLCAEQDAVMHLALHEMSVIISLALTAVRPGAGDIRPTTREGDARLASDPMLGALPSPRRGC